MPSFLSLLNSTPLRSLLLAAAILPSAHAAADNDDDAADDTPETFTALPGKSGGRSTIRLWAENDLGWSDKYYTSGVKFAYTSPEIFAKDTPLFFRDLIALTPLSLSSPTQPAAYRFHFGLTHEIYTPKHEYDHTPPPGDHPYSGLLYATFALSSETASSLDAIELSTGVIGPSATAKQAQNGWHRFIDEPLANGWHTQLHDEPILQFAWTRVGRYNWAQFGGFEIEWLPRIHVEIGTVRDYAAIGSQWRIGWHLPRDFGTGGIHSSIALARPARNFDAPLTFSSALPDSAWLFIDAQAEAWLWNAPLEGNVWHHSTKVHARPFAGGVAVGIAAQWNGWTLSITENLRTQAFRGQDKQFSAFTSISLGITF
ncbi:MAG: lipid A deacylase LpxR family protein [Puniceicoccales bacterium]|jgi:hypothetical protein|nr:lipid A deacylase LpxR family protein [Puniceicoccales bacterium]